MRLHVTILVVVEASRRSVPIKVIFSPIIIRIVIELCVGMCIRILSLEKKRCVNVTGDRDGPQQLPDLSISVRPKAKENLRPQLNFVLTMEHVKVFLIILNIAERPCNARLERHLDLAERVSGLRTERPSYGCDLVLTLLCLMTSGASGQERRE
jgi:hypothetical protein